MFKKMFFVSLWFGFARADLRWCDGVHQAVLQVFEDTRATGAKVGKIGGLLSGGDASCFGRPVIQISWIIS